MKNKPYALYEVSYIKDIKDMLEQKEKNMPDDIAFTYFDKQNMMMERPIIIFIVM